MEFLSPRDSFRFNTEPNIGWRVATRPTLAADGPSFDDPTETAHYRDVIQLDGSDRKRLTSWVQGADGTWKQFMQAEYTRVK